MISEPLLKMYDLYEDNQLTLFDSKSIDFVKKIRNLPKIELHRHLTGSITTSSAIKFALKYNIDLPTFINSELDTKLSPNNCNNDLKEYFKSWEILNKLFSEPAAIYDISWDAIYDAHLDNIAYLELRMAPRWFLGDGEYGLPDFINAFKSASKDASNKFGIITRGIVGIPRHIFKKIPTENRIRMFAKIVSDIGKFGDGIFVGIDLNGDELVSNGSDFKSFFEIGHKNGLGITIHAGEIGPAENVKYAIESLKAKRIGHGIAAFSDIEVKNIAIDNNITFELCPTSNQLLGLYESYDRLPLRLLLNEGVKFAICTDNPARCKVTLSEELIKIARYFNFNYEEVVKLEEMKIDAIFDNDDMKQILFQKILKQ